MPSKAKKSTAKRKWYLVCNESRSRCPNCKEKAVILMKDDGPVFFICNACREVRQAGIGLLGCMEKKV